MHSVRAKFVVDQVKRQGTDGAEITLHAVTEGSAENDSFFKYTPSGQIRLSIVNPAASAVFGEGKEYYVEFIPAGQPT